MRGQQAIRAVYCEVANVIIAVAESIYGNSGKSFPITVSRGITRK